MVTVDTVWKMVAQVREHAPLVHNITNYVVMNSTANALLAVGASPVMAHAGDEVEDMVAIAGALVVNIGTLSPPWVEAMERAIRAAAHHSVPVVLDPVGAGATPMRTQAVQRLLAVSPPAVVRGNASEIQAVCVAEAKTRGVDSTAAAEDAQDSARKLARQIHGVVSVSGAVDLVTDGNTVIRVANGVPMMTRVTGLGCTASALTGAFLAVTNDRLAAAVGAMVVMGVAGELAAEQSSGPGSLQVAFLDILHRLSQEDLSVRMQVTGDE